MPSIILPEGRATAFGIYTSKEIRIGAFHDWLVYGQVMKAMYNSGGLRVVHS